MRKRIEREREETEREIKKRAKQLGGGNYSKRE